MGNEWAEIRHSPYSHEDEKGKKAAFDSKPVYLTEESSKHMNHVRPDYFRYCQRCDLSKGDACKGAAETDGNEEQRFELFFDGEIDKQYPYPDHNDLACSEVHYPHGVEKRRKGTH